MTSTYEIIHAAKHAPPAHVGELINDLTDLEFRVLENRLRRMAHRQQLTLTRARRRDPHAHDYGTYTLTDHNGRTLLAAADVVDVILRLLGVARP